MTDQGGTGQARLSSMTGYARSSGQVGPATWSWELKSVNAKGLDLRLRLPPGFDALDAPVRLRLGGRLRRGTVQASLALQRPRPDQAIRIDKERLAALVAAVSGIALPPGIAPATLDGLLALPGVVEVTESEARDGAGLEPALLAGLDVALEALDAMRAGEGAVLAQVLEGRLSAIAALVEAADRAPGRAPEAVRLRLARRVADLSEAVPALDSLRLHQEAVLLAAKADVREEIDRLAMHQAAAAALLAEGGAVGRRLDFLAQELGREAGTLCAKSNDADLTATGLALRTEIEQFREQVQNLE